jgi:ABC-type dipeptide/oligopeptide/nickel transport system permease component
MRQYIIKRLLLIVPTLLLVSAIVFSLTRLIPGDVVVLMFEEKAYAKDLDALRAKLGLDKPLYVQYGTWLGKVAQGDLGESLWTKRPVLEEIVRRLPVSAELGAMAIVVALLLALPIGVLSAIRQDTMQDYTARSLAIVGLSVPAFWKATLVIVLPFLARRPYALVRRAPLPAVSLRDWCWWWAGYGADNLEVLARHLESRCHGPSLLCHNALLPQPLDDGGGIAQPL